MQAAPVAGRIRGVIMTAVAVGAMAFALLSHRWGTSGQTDALHVGLRDAVVCEDGTCKAVGYTKILDPDRYKTFVTLGAMTFWLGASAAAALLGAFVLALAKVPIGAVLSPARIAIVLVALAIAFGLLFALQKPDFLDKRGLAGIVFCAGGVVGLVGAITLSRWEKTYAMEKAMVD